MSREIGSYRLSMNRVSATSTPSPVTVPSTPAVPTSVTSTPGNGYVFLDWGTVSAATSYNVQQWDASRMRWDSLPTSDYSVSFSGSSATVRGVTNGIRYYHRVRSSNANGNSNWSGQAYSTPTVSLSRPTGLTASGYANGTVRLNWPGITNALEYRARQWDGPAATWRILPFRGSGRSSTYTIDFIGSSATVSNLSRGGVYTFSVQAKNGEVYSTWSVVATAVMP